jgi:coproporphyrinogen III oxidase-like Fe-S oxidoreductase
MRGIAQTVCLDPGACPAPEDVVAAFPAPFGLYLHVPFCRSICPYCPYNKVLLRGGMAAPYFAALRAELDLYRVREIAFDSLYVGGGTPSLCLGELEAVLDGLDVAHERAIEVLPTHATPEAVARLHALRFDYVSLGIQSFDDRMLRHLGRLNTAEDNRLALEGCVGAFGCVNADLIFDVAFVEPDVFLRDLETCCHSGVEQISTYPLMHFGYTPFGRKEHDPRREHDLLRRACEVADGLGYERRSVWTFTRRGAPLYASIARELYLGCGAGAVTFTGADLLVDHFGLAQYERALAGGRLPLARRARLGPRRAALYYAFWQLYAPGIDVSRFERLFPGAPWVTPLLATLRRLGYLEPRDDGRLHLSERGLDRYHEVERWVTYHLIEPLWEEMLEEHPGRGQPATVKPERPSAGSTHTSRRSTRAAGGPRRATSTMRSTSSGRPSNTASTQPSSRFRTHPVTPWRSAARRIVSRNQTP